MKGGKKLTNIKLETLVKMGTNRRYANQFTANTTKQHIKKMDSIELAYNEKILGINIGQHKIYK